jgi:hypothetical protein
MYLSSCVRHISLSLMSFRFIHAVTNDNFLHFQVKNIPLRMYHVSFIHSSVDRHLSWFYTSATIVNAAGNMNVSSISSHLMMMWVGTDLFGFILFGNFWSYWICKFLSIAKFKKFLAIMLSVIFSNTLFLLFTWDSGNTKAKPFVLSYRTLTLFILIFLFLFFLRQGLLVSPGWP